MVIKDGYNRDETMTTTINLDFDLNSENIEKSMPATESALHTTIP